jgi:hypothetical protein
MKKYIIFNLIFIIIAVFFLILSLILNFVFFIPFFILPLCCWLPFAFRGKKYMRSENEQDYESIYPSKTIEKGVRLCPVCKGEIKEPIAKYCYHCGSKLHND